MSQIFDRADFYREGSGNKIVYSILLVKETDGQEPGEYRVDFQYRGGSGTKIQGVSLNEARKVFSKLFREKTGRGYQLFPESWFSHTKASSAKESIKPIEPLKRKILWKNLKPMKGNP